MIGRYSKHPEPLERVQKILALPVQNVPVSKVLPPKGHPRLSAQQVEQLVAGYVRGLTLRQLAAEHGLHPDTVGKALDRRGIARRQSGLTDSQSKEAIALYARGWSLARIGRLFGVTANTVRSALLKAGVRTRDTQGRDSLIRAVAVEQNAASQSEKHQGVSGDV